MCKIKYLIWISIIFLLAHQLTYAQNPFLESGGLLIIEAESDFIESEGGWNREGTNPTYLIGGNNHFGNTNGQALSYSFKISQSGVYRLHMKSDITGTNGTESNDTWFKIENTPDVHYFCVQGGQLANSTEFINILQRGTSSKIIYYPKGNAENRVDHGNENPGNSGFFKIYRSGAPGIKWQARTIDNNGFPVYAYFPIAGEFTITISERSAGHKLDRFALVHIDSIGSGPGSNNAIANQLNGPESMRQNGCPPAGEQCDDNDSSTFNDLTNGSCGCVGTPCPAAGTSCDDGNPNTINDVEDGNCNCLGTDPEEQSYWLEAECAQVGNSWTIVNDSEASGGQYLTSPNSTSTGAPPTNVEDLVTFHLNVGQAGIYRIFSRNSTSNDDDDSFWVRVNSGNWIKWNKINYPYLNGDFVWNQVGHWESGNSLDTLTFSLNAGLNQIEFAWREPGIKFDKVFLSKTNIPMGMGALDVNCGDCVPNYENSNRLTGDLLGQKVYTTIGVLESTQKISGLNTSILYQSPVSSTLESGFESILGAELLIRIAGCN